MKKITGTIAKNIKKEAVVLGGDSGSLQSNYTSAKDETTLPEFRFPLAQQRERVLPGGAVRGATAVEFPVSQNIHKTLPLY